MADNLSDQYQQQVERSNLEVFAPAAPKVQLEMVVPRPARVQGDTRTDEELAAMGLGYPTPSPELDSVVTAPTPQEAEPPRKEFTVETPEVQAVRATFQEEMAKIGTGEMAMEKSGATKALESVGEAGRVATDFMKPAIEAAATHVGLTEEAAATFAKVMVEYLAGLPGKDDSKQMAGVQTLLATLPMVAGVVKGSTVTGKALNELVGKEFKKAVKILQSERGSVPALPGGGKGQPPTGPPPSGTPTPTSAAGGEIGPRYQRKQKARDPKIDEAYAQAETDTKNFGFKSAVDIQRRDVIHDPQLIEMSKKTDLTLEAILELPPGTTLPAEKILAIRNILKSAFRAMKKSGKAAIHENTLEAYQQAFEDLGRTRAILVKLLGAYAEPPRSVRIMNRRLPTKGSPEKGVATTGPNGLSIVPPDPFAALKGDRPFRIADPWVNQLYDFFLALEEAAVERATVRARTMQESGFAALAHDPAWAGMAPPLQITEHPMRDFLGAITELQDEEELAQFLKSIDRPIFWDVWQEQWYNSMLTGLAPVKNLIGSPVILTAEIVNRGVSAALDSIGTGMARWVANAEIPRSVYMGEVGAMLHGVIESFGDGMVAAWKGFTRNRPITPGSSLAPEEAMPNNPADYLAALNENLPKVASTTAYLNLTGLAGRAVDYLSSLGPRMLVGGDEFNKAIAYRAELRAMALRKGYQAVAEEGLSGAQAATRIQDVKREVLTNSGSYPEIIDAAQRFAQYVTLQEELGTAGQALSHYANTVTLGERGAGGLNGFPIGKFVFPFTKIVTNSTKMMGEWSGPLALLSNAVRTELEAGGARAATQMGKVATSSMLIAVFAGLAENGLITGTGPRQKDAKRQWQEEDGKVPVGIYDPVTKTYRHTNGFDPYNSVMGTVADFVEIFSSIEPGTPLEDKAMIALEGFTLAVANNIGVKSYLMGLVGMGNAAMSGDITSMDEFIKKTLPNVTIPYMGALRQVRQGLDPAMRQAMDAVEYIKRDLPGLSATLPPERDALGEILLRNGGWWNPWAHGTSAANKDIWRVLGEHGVVIGKPQKSLDGIPLTTQQYEEYMKLSTEGLADALQEQLVETSADLTDADVELIVNREVSSRRRDAQQAMRESEDFPDLTDKLQAQAERKGEGTSTRPNKFLPGRLAPLPIQIQ